MSEQDLPLFPEMDDAFINRVVRVVKSIPIVKIAEIIGEAGPQSTSGVASEEPR